MSPSFNMLTIRVSEHLRASDSNFDRVNHTDAITLISEGLIQTRLLRPSRPVSEAESHTDIFAARIKSTGALNDNGRLANRIISVQPAHAKDLPIENVFSESRRTNY